MWFLADMENAETGRSKRILNSLKQMTQCEWLCKSFGSVLSVVPISGLYSVKCVSKDHSEGQCVFKPCKVKLLYSCLVCIVLTAGSGYFCHVVSIKEEERVSSIGGNGVFLRAIAVTVVERLSCFAKVVEGSVTLVASVWHSSKLAKCLTKLSVLDRQLGVTSTHRRVTFLASCCTLPMLSGLFGFFLTCTNYLDDASWNKDIPPLVYVCFVIFSVMKVFPYAFCAFFTLMCHMYVGRFNRIRETMQELTEMEILGTSKIRIQYCPKEQSTLADKLDYIRCLYVSLSRSVSTLNSCFNPQLLVCFVGQLYATVRNVFLTVQDAALGRVCSTGCSTGFNMVYTLSHVLSIMALVVEGESLAKTAQSVTSELEQVTTNGLSQGDKLQIQMFIWRVRGSPVYITASSMFVVGAGLLAPIAGNVMTYFLVVLQLESSDQTSSCCNCTRNV